MVQQEIRDEIQAARYFSLLVDDSKDVSRKDVSRKDVSRKDVSRKEQISFVLRYLPLRWNDI